MLSKDEINFVMKQTRMIDFRVLGCPESQFMAVVEDRARKMPAKLAEFRAKRAAAPAPATDLESQIESSKLF